MTRIQDNPIYRNLIWNMSFVIIGYGLASLTKMLSNTIWQPLKIIFLFYSILQLNGYYQNDKNLKNIYIFSLLILLTIPFSISPVNSLKRVLVMLLPMIYLATSMRVLFLQYPWQDILFALLKSFRWIYAIPMVSFILLGGNLGETDFYGDIVGAFVSNHYGWGAFVFITSQWILMQYKMTKTFSFWTIFIGLYFMLLLYSGSRSGLLSLAIAFSFWFFSRKGNVIIKIGISLILVFTISYNLGENSALSDRLEKTDSQIEETEGNTDEDYYSNSATVVDARAVTRSIGSLTFADNPRLYFTGMGIFQFREGIDKYAPWADPVYYKTGAHSSYLEIYFGCGIFVFAFFLWHFTIRPLWIYLKYVRNVYIGFFGFVLIIPFFESNITAGQFMFYPWFISVFFMLYMQDQILHPIETED